MPNSDSHEPLTQEENSGLHLISARDVKKLLRAKQEETKNRIDKTVVATVVGAIAVSFTVFFALQAQAQKTSDAGVQKSHDELVSYKQVTDERIEDLRQAIVEVKADTRAAKEDAHQANLKMDALLSRWNVPNPAPTRVDGGGEH